MKVLFLTPEFGLKTSGGLGTVINGITFPLAHLIKLDLLFLGYCETYTFYILYKIREGRVKKQFKVKDIKEAFKLLRGYDILHFFHYSQEVAEFVLYAKRYLSAKLVFSCHYLLKYEQHTRCIYPELLQVEKQIYEHVDCVHVLNHNSYKILIDCYPVLRQKKEINIIPNGVARYHALKSFKILPELKPDDFIILTVSRWCHGKGLEYLLEAIPLVLDQFQHVKFIIGGRKEISWENNVGDYVKKIDEKIVTLKDYVFSIGWLKKNEIATLLNKAALWVFPSELEYFPYGLLEPMIYKVPIITARFNGFSEIVDEGYECLAFQPGNAYELAEKIISLIKNPELRNKLRLAAYHKAITKYNWKNISLLYYAMYSSLL